MLFSIGSFCGLDEVVVYCFTVSHGSLLTLCRLCLHSVHSSDLWPLCLCLQITSEVHLFSHTKGKRHQQAVRDSSSIQGRELSDEEVVHILVSLSFSHIHTLTGTNIHSPCQRILPSCCSWYVKGVRDPMVIFYDMVIILFMLTLIYCLSFVAGFVWVQMDLEMYTVMVQCLSRGGDITPLSQGCFYHEAPFHGKAAR